MAHRGLLFRLDDRAMASLRPLRGGCQCGRNTYIIERPADASDLAEVLFNTESIHRTFIWPAKFSQNDLTGL